MKTQSGSDIAKEIIRLVFGNIHGEGIDFIKSKLDGKVLVDEEDWKYVQQKMLKNE